MKNNIDSKLIFNRKMIMELRFTPIPKFLDLKGSLISAIDDLNIIPDSRWGLGDSIVKISDTTDTTQERARITVELSKLSYVTTKVNSVSEFFEKFESIYNSAVGVLGELDLVRVGCRIQGTYKTKSTQFKPIVENFKKSFPSTVFLEEYPVNDLKFQVVYQNGMYNIGPVNNNDPFLEKEFPYSERSNSIGIAVDTDNYLLKTSNGDINSIDKIKDVFIASLSVEKSLVENLENY